MPLGAGVMGAVPIPKEPLVVESDSGPLGCIPCVLCEGLGLGCTRGYLEMVAEDEEEGPAFVLPVRIHSGLKCKLCVDGTGAVGSVEDEDAIVLVGLISLLASDGCTMRLGPRFAQCGRRQKSKGDLL